MNSITQIILSSIVGFCILFSLPGIKTKELKTWLMVLALIISNAIW